MAGGEARAVTDIPRGAGNPVWSPDGATIAFSSSARRRTSRRSRTIPRRRGRQRREGRRPAQTRVVRRVITRAVYRANGVADFGFVDPDRPTHIWTVAAPPSAIARRPRRRRSPPESSRRAITAGRPTDRQIYFVSDRRPRALLPRLRQRPLRRGPRRRRAGGVASIDGGIGACAVAPDGRRHRVRRHARTARPSAPTPRPDLWVDRRARRHAAQPDGRPTTSTSTAASAATSARRAARTRRPGLVGRRPHASSSRGGIRGRQPRARRRRDRAGRRPARHAATGRHVLHRRRPRHTLAAVRVDRRR